MKAYLTQSEAAHQFQLFDEFIERIQNKMHCQTAYLDAIQFKRTKQLQAEQYYQKLKEKQRKKAITTFKWLALIGMVLLIAALIPRAIDIELDWRQERLVQNYQPEIAEHFSVIKTKEQSWNIQQ